AKTPAAKPARTAPATAPAAPERRRLKFHEKHALETLPKQIADMKEKVGALQAKLADPDLYARDPAAFTAASEALVAAQDELSAAEDKWLELEILREEIENS